MCPIYKDSQIAVQSTTASPSGFTKLGNDSYKVVAQKMKWDEARRQCQADDADLASILDPVIHSYIILQISKHNEPVWIGLNSNVVKGLFKQAFRLRQGSSICVSFASNDFFLTDWRAIQMGRQLEAVLYQMGRR